MQQDPQKATSNHEPGTTENLSTYQWESFSKSWESVRETRSGRLTVLENAEPQTKKTTKKTSHFRRGLQRAMCVIVDNSASMVDRLHLLDYSQPRPSPAATTLKQCEEVLLEFVSQYFTENPLSQLQLLCTSKKVASVVTPLSGNRAQQMNGVPKACGKAEGEPSLQNALLLAHSTLCQIPRYGTREVLIFFSSLSTCDPGNIYKTVHLLKSAHIIVHIISLSAELFVCKRIAELTGGEYRVAKNFEHFRTVALSFCQPPTTLTLELPSKLTEMGFPRFCIPLLSSEHSAVSGFAFCCCHKEIQTKGLYQCPQCFSFVCDLPMHCKVCGLLLVSPPLLTRSHHHLFPLDPFLEYTLAECNEECVACLKVVEIDEKISTCPKCKREFCLQCATFIHESLFNCPGCLLNS
jgi:transcription initiation factor TFIIH subunit 2